MGVMTCELTAVTLQGHALSLWILLVSWALHQIFTVYHLTRTNLLVYMVCFSHLCYKLVTQKIWELLFLWCRWSTASQLTIKTKIKSLLNMQYNSLRRFRDRNKCEKTVKNMMKTIYCNCTYLPSARYARYIHPHISMLCVTYTRQGQHILDTASG